MLGHRDVVTQVTEKQHAMSHAEINISSNAIIWNRVLLQKNYEKTATLFHMSNPFVL